MDVEKIRQSIKRSNPARAKERLKLFQIICDKLDQGKAEEVKNHLIIKGDSIQENAENLEKEALGSSDDVESD